MKWLAYRDFDCERIWYPWHRRWWYWQSWRFVLGPFFRFLRHRLNLWHKEEGATYLAGRAVTPATYWRGYAKYPESLKTGFIRDKCTLGYAGSVWPRRWIARWLGVA